MRKWFFLLFLPLLPVTLLGQRNISSIVDTVETSAGAVILYKNYTWEYLQDEPAMMSPEDDSTGLFSQEWITNQVFAYPGILKRDSIKDTVIALTTSSHLFSMPIYGKLFRGFTYTHKGLDIDLDKGDTVDAAFDGVVRYAKYNRGGFGNLVIIRHYNGLETYYAHLSKILVACNQVVRAGDRIGLGGSTGRSRAPHLHFEIRYKDIPLDPLRVLDFDGKKLKNDTLSICKKSFYPADYDGKAVYYKIRKGDTLGRIAQKNRTTVKELCALNKIRPNTVLRVGHSIRVK